MHLRRSNDTSSTATSGTVPLAAWDELPAAPAGAPVIRAPRAGDLVAPSAAPLAA